MLSRSIVMLVLALAPGAAWGFHSGGAGACSGCHGGHDATSSGSLLRSPNPSDICLNCHETPNGNTWGKDLVLPGPTYGGGPFVFLGEDNLNDGPDAALSPIGGHRAGHSIVSFAKGTSSDPDHASAPGGTYPSSSLTCISCHDPHGKGGHYRLLYGADSGPSRSQGHEFVFNTPAPEAVGIDVEGPPESEGNHNAYRSGMSAWCGNCHGAYHASGATGFRHPVDVALGVEEVNTYNLYRGTGFLDGTPTDSYLPAVPLEVSGGTRSFRGPATGTSRISCLSCHRAHASSGPRAGRWDFTISTWVEEGKASGSWPIPNPYETSAGPTQKPLCEKCHGPSGP